MSGRELYEKIISELVTKNSVKASKSITRLLSNQKDLDNSNFNKIFKKLFETNLLGTVKIDDNLMNYSAFPRHAGLLIFYRLLKTLKVYHLRVHILIV